MTLRTKFFFLILGAIVVPALSMMGAIIIYKDFMNLTNPALQAREFENRIQELETIEGLPSLMETFDDSYFSIIVQDPESIVSTYDIQSNHNENQGKMSHPRMILSSTIQELTSEQKVLVIFGIDLSDINNHIFIILFATTSLIALIIISLLIIRSINKSINRLEGATREIARGNLDFEIDTCGQDKFGSLARSLDTMRDQIKMEYDRRNRFFMGISHDLKTPLASITGYADALMEGMAEDKRTTDKYLGS